MNFWFTSRQYTGHMQDIWHLFWVFLPNIFPLTSILKRLQFCKISIMIEKLLLRWDHFWCILKSCTAILFHSLIGLKLCEFSAQTVLCTVYETQIYLYSNCISYMFTPNSILNSCIFSPTSKKLCSHVFQSIFEHILRFHCAVLVHHVRTSQMESKTFEKQDSIFSQIARTAHK